MTPEEKTAQLSSVWLGADIDTDTAAVAPGQHAYVAERGP